MTKFIVLRPFRVGYVTNSHPPLVISHKEVQDSRMRCLALLTDVHANLPALQAVLEEVAESDAQAIVFLGDIIGYGASPAACVKLVRQLGGHCVLGNHDAFLPQFRENEEMDELLFDPKNSFCAGMMLAAQELEDDDAEWLIHLPYKMRLPGAKAAHGSLHEPEEFHYIENLATAGPTLELLIQSPEKIGFLGHTHLKKIFTTNPADVLWLDPNRCQIAPDAACAITVGAVGQPREVDHKDAQWALWYPDERIVEFRKTPYDRLRAAEDIRRAGLPRDSWTRLLSDEDW
jgi:predicted phosphodiesterase